MRRAIFFLPIILMFLALTTAAQNNIGIGISDPQYPLHIYKNSSDHIYLNFANATTGAMTGDGVLVGLDPAEDFRIHSYENNNFRFHINNSEKMRLTNLGRLGIGTSSPNELLHIWHETEAAVRIESDHNGFSSIKLVEPLGLGFEFEYATSTDDLTLWSRTILSNQAVATWLDSGHFGLGTTAPTARLEVDHSGAGDIMRLRSFGTNRMRVLYGGDVAIDSTTLYVDEDQNRVGLGTTSPESRLQITDNASTQTAIILDNTGTGDPGIRFRLNGLTKFMMGLDRSDIKFTITETSSLGSQVRLELDEPGNLAIAGEYGYLEAREYTHQVFAAEFHETSSPTHEFILAPGDYRQFTPSSTSTTEYMIAPLHLPQGAVITEIAIYYYDASATERITSATIDLWRKSLTGPTSSFGTVAASTTNSYSNGIVQVETTPVTLAVDNTQHRFILYLIWDPSSNDPALRFHGSHVVYELTEITGS